MRLARRLLVRCGYDTNVFNLLRAAKSSSVISHSASGTLEALHESGGNLDFAYPLWYYGDVLRVGSLHFGIVRIVSG